MSIQLLAQRQTTYYWKNLASQLMCFGLGEGRGVYFWMPDCHQQIFGCEGGHCKSPPALDTGSGADTSSSTLYFSTQPPLEGGL